MFERILVPLDGSALAERAVPHVMEFARTFNSDIVLLRVLDPDAHVDHAKLSDPLRSQILKSEADLQLREVAARIRAGLGENPVQEAGGEKSRVECYVLEGKTSENIVDFASAEQIALLVMSTHGSGGLSRWNLNSVIHKVISLIYLPMLIIRSYHSSGSAETSVHYRRILLPLDGSRRAECALSAGISLAQDGRSKLVLASVMKPPELPVVEPYRHEIRQICDQLMEYSRKAYGVYLQGVSERLQVESETHLIEHISITSAIQDLAHQQNADLIILCAHGYASASNRPHGTVVRDCIDHGTTPLLVIQDLPRSQIRPTETQLAADSTRSR